jgi:murein DD-endopeptidase MepM/ murein hydrolase activator NlpD
MGRAGFILLALVTITACRTATLEPAPGDPQPQQTAPIRPAVSPARPTPTLTPSPEATPTATATPTPSPTPTPTALPLTVSGDPRAAGLSEPVPSGNAPCGLVDLLDCPLRPPDGEGVARGGGDFSLFRSRYDGYHTGEDWWISRGGGSFGEPVYSVGHGLVTFADPKGWGRDQGVVIVQHILNGGETIYSFYGHLDPPSIILAPGECVIRGQQVGKIGRPRTPPHLHFEIRTHLPYAPGPGYWAEDPTLAGWRPPSGTIWNQRIAASPGVAWARLNPSGDARVLGILEGDTLLILEEGQLLGLDTVDGRRVWSMPIEGRVAGALLDTGQRLLYVADQFGRLEALRLPDGQDVDGAAGLHWELDLDLFGTPALMPLPGGGLVLAVRGQVFAFSAEGELLWQEEEVGRPYDWALGGDALIFSTSGSDRSVWTAGDVGLVDWDVQLGGHLAADSGKVWLYASGGLYRLDLEQRSARLLLALSDTRLSLGDIITLPGGGVLVAHADRFDRRLLALDDSGRLTWERSYAAAVPGQARLVVHQGRPYLVATSTAGGLQELAILGIDLAQASLTRLIVAGERSVTIPDPAVYPAGEGLLVVDTGGNLAALHVILAAEEVALP